MSSKKSQRLQPSHKTGKLHDQRIKELQDPAFKAEHLHGLIKKAATTPKKR